MKKIVYFIGLFLFLSWVPKTVFADGSLTVSTGGVSMNVGESRTFSVTANNAAGRVDISSNNGCIGVSPGSAWVDNGSATITVTGNCEASGTVTVTVTDVVTYDGEQLGGARTVSVSVIQPAPPTPPPEPEQPSNPSGGGGYENIVNPVTDGKSGNANLDQLSVEGYELTKVDDTHFSLIVKNSITKVKIQAKPADSKATVSGDGEVSLVVGENNFTIVVQAENGATKEYYLVVTRKDNLYTLERIDDALEDEEQEVTVTIKEDDVITKEILEKIKKSKKEISFVQNGEDNTILYTWVVDGKNVKPNHDLKTKIDFKFDKKEEFDELVGYRQGVYLQFQNQKYPKGVKVQIYVGDQYKDGDKVSLYYYNEKNKKVTLKGKEFVVKNGMVEFTIDKDRYFLTKASLEKEDHNGVDPYVIVCVIEFILLLIFFVMVVSPRINFGFFKKEETVI